MILQAESKKEYEEVSVIVILYVCSSLTSTSQKELLLQVSVMEQ